METQKQIHCIASHSFGTAGTHQNLLQDLKKSSILSLTVELDLIFMLNQITCEWRAADVCFTFLSLYELCIAEILCRNGEKSILYWRTKIWQEIPTDTKSKTLSL